MAHFRYYLSPDPRTLAPPTRELFTIEAESVQAAVRKVDDNLTTSSTAVWVHVLVSTDEKGEQRGFKSTRLR